MRKLSYYSTKAYPVLLCLISMFIFYLIWTSTRLTLLQEMKHESWWMYLFTGLLGEILILIIFIAIFQDRRSNEWRGKMFD